MRWKPNRSPISVWRGTSWPAARFAVAAIVVSAAIAGAGIVLAVQGYEREKRDARTESAQLARDTASEASALVVIRIEYLRGIAASQPVVRRDPPAIQALLRAMLGRRAVLDDLGWVDADGKRAIAPNRLLAQTARIELSDRAYVKAVRRTRQPYVSDAIAGRISNAPIVVLAVSTFDREGRLAGALTGALAFLAGRRLDVRRGSASRRRPTSSRPRAGSPPPPRSPRCMQPRSRTRSEQCRRRSRSSKGMRSFRTSRPVRRPRVPHGLPLHPRPRDGIARLRLGGTPSDPPSRSRGQSELPRVGVRPPCRTARRDRPRMSRSPGDHASSSFPTASWSERPSWSTPGWLGSPSARGRSAKSRARSSPTGSSRGCTTAPWRATTSRSWSSISSVGCPTTFDRK